MKFFVTESEIQIEHRLVTQALAYQLLILFFEISSSIHTTVLQGPFIIVQEISRGSRTIFNSAFRIDAQSSVA